MSDSAHQPMLYTKEEAAEILKVNVSWLERRAASRQIPFTMLGGRYRFTREHLDEIVRINEQGTNSEVSGLAPAAARRRRARTQPPMRRPGVTPLRARPKSVTSRTA